MTRATRLLLLLASITFALAADARPGGGQSFRSTSPSYGSSSSSSGSSYRSSGSSYGSSDSSRSSSSSGSSWSWGRSSDSSSSSSSSSDTSSGSGYSSPSYDANYEYEKTMAEVRCMQACMAKPSDEMSACMSECKTAKPAPRSADSGSYRSRSTYRPEPPPPERPLSSYFWLPGLLLGLVSAGAGVRYLLKKRDERMWAALGADLEDFQRNAQWRNEQRIARERQPSIRAALGALQSTDDAFSWVLFEDFLHALYVEAQTLRGQGKLAHLRPYFRDSALQALATLPAVPVQAIVVGSFETLEVASHPETRRVQLKIAIEANYTELSAGGEQSYAVHEVWTLGRGADIVSRPPERARVIGCASCGAPLDKMVGDTCEHCGAPSAPGSRDWEVELIEIPHREARTPQLTGTTEEQGTDLPTLVAPDVKGEFAALGARDPEFSWAAFTQRVEHVFHTFHRSWSAQDLAAIRPYLSDQLFESQRYWVEAYRAQKLRNVTEDPQIVSLALSRVIHDKYFDALTVRVFAMCNDYTLDAAGNVVGGSREELRRYSEYWTFIRSAAKRGAARKDPVCPNCGAPIAQINMAGDCGHCHVKVTTGEFDWVLSRIEQDEVYRL